MLYRKFDCADIYRQFQEEGFIDFVKWQQIAFAATTVLVEWHNNHPALHKGDSPPINARLYGALKGCLIKYFWGKCAYCESEFTSVAWGDVEHCRPKRSVTDEKHPGYYWLAYDPRNLLPSCQKCNQGSGKRNYFPIEGIRAKCPDDDLSAELPLLLNPYEEADCGDRSKFIGYVFEEDKQDSFNLLATGRVKGHEVRGQISVRIYDLNRPDLVRRRQKNQTAAIKDLRLAMLLSAEKLGRVWRERLDPEQEHASAVRAACFA